MNSVDYGDRVSMERCPHALEARVYWIENDVGKPPQFVFEGFPEAGLVILSKHTVVVYCRECGARRSQEFTGHYGHN